VVPNSVIGCVCEVIISSLPSEFAALYVFLQAEDRMRRDTDQLQREKSTLQEVVNELKDSMLTKESEITVLQDCLRQLKNTNDEEGDDKFQALLDTGHAKAELKCMTIERDALAEKLQDEVDARKLLEGKVHCVVIISVDISVMRNCKLYSVQLSQT
jgi:chromosome segregation ATPase